MSAELAKAYIAREAVNLAEILMIPSFILKAASKSIRIRGGSMWSNGGQIPICFPTVQLDPFHLLDYTRVGVRIE